MNYSCDIIVPTYNGSKHIPKLLTSILGQKGVRYTCYVIDDHSSDNTVEIIQQDFPWVTVIKQLQNLGPSHNRNIAIDAGSNPYVVIFDDDTYLEDAEWLLKALSFMEQNPKVGQLAAMIVSGFDKQLLLDCGIRKNFYQFGGIFHNENSENVAGKHLTPRQVLGACSAGTVLRRDLFQLIGGFDAQYFYPGEDLDLSLRLHLAGYNVWYVPSLVVYHYESQAMGKSLSKKMYLFRRNCIRVLVENFPLFHVLKMLILLMGKEFVISFFQFLISRYLKKSNCSFPSSIYDYLRSILFLFRNTPKMISKRIKVNKFRKRNRNYLLQVNDDLIKNLLK